MKILAYLLLMVGGTVVCASAFPFFEYLYHRFANKETYNICHYFSQELFDIHLNQYDIKPSFMRHVINNREELADMWEQESKKNLP